MWQTFPEHTKNLTSNSQGSRLKSLDVLAHNKPQRPALTLWLRSPPSWTLAWISKPQHMKPFDIWNLLQKAKMPGGVGEERGGGRGVHTYKRRNRSFGCINSQLPEGAKLAQPGGEVPTLEPGEPSVSHLEGAQTRMEEIGSLQPTARPTGHCREERSA